jgi:hypothetical protein
MVQINWKKLDVPQRNAVVAEHVAGWRVKECDGEIGEQPISPDGWFCQKCGHTGYWGDDSLHDERPPSYTTSIDVAFTLLPAVCEDHPGCSLFITTAATGGAYVAFGTGLSDLIARQGVYVDGARHAVAEAVCIVFLRVMGIVVLL